ncbi:KipI family sensor histidine kinase inhibitor [Nakamurella sp. UYEF19]|uniref:5-oxoprolinase subunit B family protein n=1 Tax=Nakamurella sp. UYEF19 TaxID=1756392 RepID=UPI00339B9902
MIEFVRVGRTGALLELRPDGPDVALMALTVRRVASDLGIQVREVVPGARTVLIQASDAQALVVLLAALPDQPDLAPTEAQLPVVELPVRYDGPDLSIVAAATGFAVAEIVRRHQGATYRAAFTGFAPGFAYLTGLDPALRLPRLDTPRPAVPAGSVAIADDYCAVYPRRSPGGWHLLGTTTTMMFDVDRDPAALVSPGQTVRFVDADR